MKRTLLVAASLALVAAGTAHAQSAVTLYGIIDIGIGGTNQSYRHSSLGMINGMQSGSRWGLRGSEDLGNGLQANFQLESGFDPATGQRQQGGRQFGRAAWLGLSGGFGEIRFGRLPTVGSDIFIFVDPFGAGYSMAGMQSSFNGASTNRADNTVYYVSPSFSGLTGYASYTFNRNGGSAPTDDSDQLLSAVLKYDRGPFALAVTYEGAYLGSNTAWAQRTRALDPQGRVRDPYNVQLGGTWSFGMITASAAWSYMKNGFTNPDMGDDVGATGAAIAFGTVRDFPGQHANAYMAGLKADISPSTQLFGTWQMSDPSKHMFAGQDSHHQMVYSIGGTYALSPRTNFYAFYSYADGAWFDKGWHSQNYGVGLRHLF